MQVFCAFYGQNSFFIPFFYEENIMFNKSFLNFNDSLDGKIHKFEFTADEPDDNGRKELEQFVKDFKVSCSFFTFFTKLYNNPPLSHPYRTLIAPWN